MIRMYEFSTSRHIWQGERERVCTLDARILYTLFSWFINFNFAFVLAHKSLLYMQYALNNVFRFRCLDSHKTLAYSTLPVVINPFIFHRKFSVTSIYKTRYTHHIVLPRIPYLYHWQVCAQKSYGMKRRWLLSFSQNFALEFIHSL